LCTDTNILPPVSELFPHQSVVGSTDHSPCKVGLCLFNVSFS
jgi:hypothetical protein